MPKELRQRWQCRRGGQFHRCAQTRVAAPRPSKPVRKKQGPVAGFQPETAARSFQRGTNTHLTPNQEAAQSYLFPPCGGTHLIFSEIPLRGKFEGRRRPCR